MLTRLFRSARRTSPSALAGVEFCDSCSRVTGASTVDAERRRLQVEMARFASAR